MKAHRPQMTHKDSWTPMRGRLSAAVDNRHFINQF